MIESIMIGIGFFAIGALTSLILTSIALSDSIINKAVEKQVFKYKLPNGKAIHIWRGFVFPDRIHICTCDKNGVLNGDGVVFDNEGNIITVEQNEKNGQSKECDKCR